MDMEPKRVIIDTDPGFDDYWAILMFLFLQKLGRVKIEAITCTAGNSDLKNTCRNTVRLFELAGVTNIPIYKGTPVKGNSSLVGYFLDDGFGDLEDIYHPEDWSNLIGEKPAEEAINDIVAANPKDISLICMGPLTYLATILKMNSTFKNQLKDVWIMGGNDPDNKNHPTQPAEYNFIYDPESVDVVLKTLTCPVYMLPFQTGLDIDIPLAWRYSVLDFKSPTISLVTRVEKKINDLYGEAIFNLLDAYLVFAFLDPTNNIESLENVHIEIELKHPDRRGMLTFSQDGEPKVNVIKSINKERYKRFMVEVARSF